MKLALDNHFSPAIAVALRQRRHDVVAAIERAWEEAEDEALLVACAAEQRALLTNNVPDFVRIARHWAQEGRRHYGLVFTSDSGLPRRRAMIGQYVDRLGALLRDHPGDDAFADRAHWL